MSLYGNVNLVGRPDLANIQKLDLLPIPMIRRMERYGIAIDIPYFADLTDRLEREMNVLKADIADCIPPDRLDDFLDKSDSIEDWCPINVESGAQLAELLFDMLEVGRGKQLKTTKSGDRLSTGKKQLEILKKDHPVIPLILQYRERSKMRNTYTIKMPKVAKFHPAGTCCPVCELSHKVDTWRVHTTLTTTRTDTGRLASKNPALQNLPARTELGRLVRAGFIASPGYVLVTRDYAQIELRLLAHCANDAIMQEIFRTGGDIHIATACSAFDLDYAYYMLLSGKKSAGTLTPDEKKLWGDFGLQKRAPCKNVNFGIVYGLTETGLYDQMALTYATAGLPLPDYITVEWCKQFIQTWFGIYNDVEPYMSTQSYRARRYKMVWEQLGRIRRVPEVSSVHSWIRSAGLRQAGNMPIQSLAAGVMKIGMARVEDNVLLPWLADGVWCWPLLPVHDELVIEAEEDYAEGLGELIGDELNLSMTDTKTGRNLCSVPIKSDGKVMARWQKD